MGALKYRVKWVVVHLLYALGILHLWKRTVLRRRAVVLMYHRVLPQDACARTWSHPGIVVTRDTFDRQMRVLRKAFRPLTLEEFEARLEGGAGFEPGSCLVTFDDGWIDTYTEALPALRRHGVPALVFLPARYVGTGEMFWQERLGAVLHAIWARARGDAAFAERARPALAGFGLASVMDLAAADVRERVIEIVRERKAQGRPDPAEPVRALAALVDGADPGPDDVDAFMTWDHVREMRRHGVTFGGHGDTHRMLTTLAAAEVEREVAASRLALEAALGEPPRAFAYPNGDWNAPVADAVRRGRFATAFCTSPGHAGPGENRLAVRRINIHEDMTSSTPMFLARVLRVI